MSLSRFLFRMLLGRRLPRTVGRLAVPGLQGPVTVRRDGWGVPHIEAQSDHDAWFGLGFCHGQDRAFQLEVWLRLTRGTMAELFGKKALHADMLSRTIGFHRTARKQVGVLDADVRAQIEAYCAGVNAGATLGLPRRPHELAILRAQPTPWTVADVLGLLKVQSFLLASNWDVELARLQVLTADGPEALAALEPRFLEWLPPTAPAGAAAGRAADYLADDLAAFTALARPGGGSNNWALTGRRTATGRPLVANDPHLSAAVPPHWYLAHLRTPEWAAAGATFVGVPALTAGHNGFAAWGITAGVADNTDLFREKFDPDMPGCPVVEADGSVSGKPRGEHIHVRGQGTIVLGVLITPRGPVVSGPLGAQTRFEGLSLRATWLEPKPIRGLLTLHRVRSFADFRRELSQWPLGTMNMVYADATGAAGWQFAGTVPRRKRGRGLVPLPAWEPDTGWEDDPVPFEELPHLVCDENGDDFVCTANSQPLPAGEGPFLGADWMDGYRQSVLTETLSGCSDWDVARSMALQTDRRTHAWRDVREVVLGLPAGDEAAEEGLALLRAWDGVLAADSAAAAVYEMFMNEVIHRAARAKAPKAWEWALGKGVGLLPFNFFCFRRTGHAVRLIREQPPGWFARSWPDELADALAAAVRLLRSKYGRSPTGWGWGRIRTLTMHHPLGTLRLFRRIFNLGPVPCGGDNDTVAQASVQPLAPLAQADNIPSVRVVVDVGAWDDSRYVLPGGQSGNPLSPHYADQFPLWCKGEGIPIPFTPDAVRQATRQTLELRPG